MTSNNATPIVDKTRLWIEYLATWAFFFFGTKWIGQIIPSVWFLFAIGFLFFPLTDLILPWRHSKFDLGPDYLGFKYPYLPIVVAGILGVIAVILMLNTQGQSARIYQFSAVAGFFSWWSVQQLSTWFKLQKMSTSK